VIRLKLEELVKAEKESKFPPLDNPLHIKAFLITQSLGIKWTPFDTEKIIAEYQSEQNRPMHEARQREERERSERERIIREMTERKRKEKIP